MKKVQARISLMAGAWALAIVASGNSFAQTGQHHGAAVDQASQQHGMGGTEMMQAMQGMHQKMSSMQMTGDHSHDFATMMRSHHQAGIEMAKAELKNGKDPEMKKMAKKMISEQTADIKKLDQWLSKHQAPSK